VLATKPSTLRTGRVHLKEYTKGSASCVVNNKSSVLYLKEYTKGYMNKLSKSVFPAVRLEISPQRRVWLTTRAEERRGNARPLISGNCPIWVYFRLAILTRLDTPTRDEP
jgi:hypothetical protein